MLTFFRLILLLEKAKIVDYVEVRKHLKNTDLNFAISYSKMFNKPKLMRKTVLLEELERGKKIQ